MQSRIKGYTTGVYDMFHIGHLRLLQKARSYCDHLVVGVSSDELVKEYKNKKPIIPLENRMEIIGSLACVDEVVVQSSRNKIQQFHDVKYDVMFVGDDWKGTKLFAELGDYLDKHGASIEYFEYTKDVSSTQFSSILQEIYDSERLIK